MTRVIHIRDAPPGWETNPRYVYIGRAGKGHNGEFGNPFKLAHGESRGATLDKFRKYFLERIKSDTEFKERVGDLHDKVLVCFCRPNLCHGDVIAEFMNGSPP
jgi:hypothetical protein